MAISTHQSEGPEFISWVNGVKADRVSAEACLKEFEENLGENEGHYELGGLYTSSRNPATIRFKESDLVWDELDA